MTARPPDYGDPASRSAACQSIDGDRLQSLAFLARICVGDVGTHDLTDQRGERRTFNAPRATYTPRSLFSTSAKYEVHACDSSEGVRPGEREREN